MSRGTDDSGALAREGRNCWRVASANRFAFLVDAADYFDAVADAIESARRSVMVIGWDLHSRVRLRRGGGASRSELASLLDTQVRRRDALDVRILSWDFSMIFALEREQLPAFRFAVETHPRVHFRLDAAHPPGACHHQKIVVVDDAVAFTGGIDLTMRRWDTQGHPPGDPRRVDPGGRPYEPFHDVQCVLDGDAAAALGELARSRWERATGESIPRVETDHDPWPRSVVPDAEDVHIGIARTDRGTDGRVDIREIAALYRDAIGSARRWIYIEHQYLSSDAIRSALEESLGKETGPEIVIVAPERMPGWLEQKTMGRLRARFARRLREADRDGRLRIVTPRSPGADGHAVQIHSKVCVVDDAFATVGSANLSTRSMGLDTECNVFLEGGNRGDIRETIAAFRNRLLGEHLGVSERRVAEALRETGSLASTLDALNPDPPRLVPLRDEAVEGTSNFLVDDPSLLDPERPVSAAVLLESVVGGPEDEKDRPDRRTLVWVVATLAALVLVWQFSPASEWDPIRRAPAWVDAYRHGPLALPLTLVLYVVAGFFMVPLTLLITQTAILFDPVDAVIHATLGSLASASATYGVGRLIGRRLLRSGPGSWGTAVRSILRRQGVLSFASVRLLPIAPYGVVNLIAGAYEVRFRSYLLGTLLGLAPGIVALTLAGGQFARWVRDPSGAQLALLFAGVAALWAVLALVTRRIRAVRARAGEAESETP